MKQLFSAFIVISCFSFVHAQESVPRMLRKTITLEMALKNEDLLPGKRGASVVWHPLQKKYYAAMAGNQGFPLCVFDGAGKRLSNDNHVCLVDVRGLWYNPQEKMIQGNGYDTIGWFNYKLAANGMIDRVEVFRKGINQPGEQCAGAYNPVKNKIIFLKESQVFFYAMDGSSVDSVAIHWGWKKSDGLPEDEDITREPEGYNINTVVYTLIPGSELGFLNAVQKQIELYDKETGFLTKILRLPEEVTAEESFNFAYSYGTYWLFDMKNRTWTGYK